MIGGWLADLRHGVRVLRASPALSMAGILTLALGIGANTSIYSVVSAVLLQPLPYADADRLQAVFLVRSTVPDDRSSLSAADFLVLQEESTVFESSAAYYSAFGGEGFALTGGGTPEQVAGTRATAGLFETLGVPAALGRTFLPEDGRPEAPAVVVLGHGLWQRRFAGDPAVLGSIVSLDGQPHTIIGVMPPDFAFPRATAADLFPIARFEPQAARPPFYLRVVARPRAGIGAAGISTDLARVASRIKERYPNSAVDWTMGADPLKEMLVGDLRPALLVLLGAVSLVLLIASANIASLLLARAAARRKEMAIRAALGAGQARLARLALTESLVLAGFGGAAGVLLSAWGTDLLVALAPRDLPRLGEVRLDGGVLLYTLGVTVLTGLLAGLAPALQGRGGDLVGILRQAGRAGSDGTGRRLRRILVVGEFAMAVMLLGGAALLLNSFVRLQRVSPGFEPAALVSMRLSLPEVRYPDGVSRTRFFGSLLERTAALPGVRSTAVSMALPPDLLVMTNPYTVEGRPVPAGQSAPAVAQLLVSPGFFQTLGVPLRSGRVLTEADAAGAPGVIVINETMARQVFAGEDPIGRRLATGDPGPNPDWLTIVGVVGDVKYTGLEAPPEPTMYTSYLQDNWWPSMYLVVRTERDPELLVPAVRAEVGSLDAELPIAEVRTMENLLHASVSQPRFRTTLVGIFAIVAVLLAAVGAYGLLSHAVGQRTQEMGIRMALGARRRDILRLVIGDGMRLVAGGTALGILGGLGLGRVLSGLLFGISPTDPGTYVGVAAIITGVALLACWLPARRATRIDPMVALRYE